MRYYRLFYLFLFLFVFNGCTSLGEKSQEKKTQEANQLGINNKKVCKSLKKSYFCLKKSRNHSELQLCNEDSPHPLSLIKAVYEPSNKPIKRKTIQVKSTGFRKVMAHVFLALGGTEQLEKEIEKQYEKDMNEKNEAWKRYAFVSDRYLAEEKNIQKDRRVCMRRIANAFNRNPKITQDFKISAIKECSMKTELERLKLWDCL